MMCKHKEFYGVGYYLSSALVNDFHGKILSEVHRMVERHLYIPVLGKPQEILCAVVSAVRYVEYLCRLVLYKKQCLYPADSSVEGN